MNILGFILTFALSMILAPIIIKTSKKLKFGQNILSYVSEHSSKQGTPTMGGIIFILPTIIVSLFFLKSNLTISILCLIVFLGYGVIGFLDDFIKIKYKRNLGLLPYQKIIFQVLIAIIVSLFAFNSNLIPNSIYVPFSTNKIDLGWFFIPFIIIVFLSTTNSVNLTDGLDGLAGSVSLIFFVAIAIIGNFYLGFGPESMQEEYVSQMQNLNTILWCVSGGLLAFLVFNFYPAKIFMGDTGSLSLGGLIAIVCCFNGTSLYIPIIGLMFVLSALSVIIQVLYFKKTQKRIFLMAPFHHHLQHKGMHETKIVFIYIVITFMLALLSFLFLGLV